MPLSPEVWVAIGIAVVGWGALAAVSAVGVLVALKINDYRLGLLESRQEKLELKLEQRLQDLDAKIDGLQEAAVAPAAVDAIMAELEKQREEFKVLWQRHNNQSDTMIQKQSEMAERLSRIEGTLQHQKRA